MFVTDVFGALRVTCLWQMSMVPVRVTCFAADVCGVWGSDMFVMDVCGSWGSDVFVANICGT